jgi:hypothetical protein
MYIPFQRQHTGITLGNTEITLGLPDIALFMTPPFGLLIYLYKFASPHYHYLFI